MRKRIGPPLLAFVLVRLFLWLAAHSFGHHANRATSWAHWDSAHYLRIAEAGYEFFSCERLPGYDPKMSCGNTAWLPGYQLSIHVLSWFGVKPVVAGALLSGAFTLGLLGLLWNLFCNAETSVANLLALGLAAFFPGHIYDHAVFPISLFALLQVAALRCYIDRRFAWAGLLGGLASFTYSSGLFLCGVFAVHMLLSERDRSPREQLRNLVLAPGLVALGFVAVLVLQTIEVGVWNAYFRVQDKYAYALTSPLAALRSNFAIAYAAIPHGTGPCEQTIFVAVLCCLVLGRVLSSGSRSRTDTALSVFVLIYWLTPLMLGGKLSLYRAEATLLPGVVPLAAKLRWPLLGIVLLLAMVLSRLMAKRFFDNALI